MNVLDLSNYTERKGGFVRDYCTLGEMRFRGQDSP